MCNINGDVPPDLQGDSRRKEYYPHHHISRRLIDPCDSACVGRKKHSDKNVEGVEARHRDHQQPDEIPFDQPEPVDGSFDPPPDYGGAMVTHQDDGDAPGGP